MQCECKIEDMEKNKFSQISSDRVLLPDDMLDDGIFLKPYTPRECIGLNLHSRVKIEDESHGCGSNYSSVKPLRSGRCFTAENEDVHLSFLPFCSNPSRAAW